MEKQINQYKQQEDGSWIGYTRNGEEFRFDNEDYERVIEYNWYLHKGNGYIETHIYKENKKRTKLKIHRLIMNPPDNMQIDHINHDKTDNRRQNLRICTNAENQYNQSKRKDNTSGYKGVHWFKNMQKWTAQIWVNNKKIHLRCFDNLEEATKAYKIAADKYFGEFASY